MTPSRHSAADIADKVNMLLSLVVDDQTRCFTIERLAELLGVNEQQLATWLAGDDTSDTLHNAIIQSIQSIRAHSESGAFDKPPTVDSARQHIDDKCAKVESRPSTESHYPTAFADYTATTVEAAAWLLSGHRDALAGLELRLRMALPTVHLCPLWTAKEEIVPSLLDSVLQPPHGPVPPLTADDITRWQGLLRRDLTARVRATVDPEWIYPLKLKGPGAQFHPAPAGLQRLRP